MKLLLEIPDKKAPAVLEVLNSIPYIKMKPLDSEDETLINGNKKSQTSSTKEAFLQNFKQAIEEVNLIKEGKLKGTNAKDLLNEL